jgi:hypothetical protein
VKIDGGGEGQEDAWGRGGGWEEDGGGKMG